MEGFAEDLETMRRVPLAEEDERVGRRGTARLLPR